MKHFAMKAAITAATLLFLSITTTVSSQTVDASPAESRPETRGAGSVSESGQESGKAEQDSHYMRILRNAKGEPTAMQTSIVSFVQGTPAKTSRRGNPTNGIVVDLIGAVHVADKQYFQKLNRLFERYDALLYELVAPEDSNIPQGGNSLHPVGQMQQRMKSMLNLAYQLEEVDYRKRNFVHADMSPHEFSRVMSERNESWLSMMLKMMGSAMATQTAKGNSDADLIFALFAKDRPLRLKRVMATQFSNLEGTMSVLEGENGSTIIGMRNKKALDVLNQELKKGKKRIGIFYGAGHFPDMEKRLKDRFGMSPKTDAITWLTAWDMSDK